MMKSQGEVDAEYHDAHTFIQQVQDEISQVLDGVLGGQPPQSHCPPQSSLASSTSPSFVPSHPSAPGGHGGTQQGKTVQTDVPGRDTKSRPSVPIPTPNSDGIHHQGGEGLEEFSASKRSEEDVTNAQFSLQAHTATSQGDERLRGKEDNKTVSETKQFSEHDSTSRSTPLVDTTVGVARGRDGAWLDNTRQKDVNGNSLLESVTDTHQSRPDVPVATDHVDAVRGGYKGEGNSPERKHFVTRQSSPTVPIDSATNTQSGTAFPRTTDHDGGVTVNTKGEGETSERKHFVKDTASSSGVRKATGKNDMPGRDARVQKPEPKDLTHQHFIPSEVQEDEMPLMSNKEDRRIVRSDKDRGVLRRDKEERSVLMNDKGNRSVLKQKNSLDDVTNTHSPPHPSPSRHQKSDGTNTQAASHQKGTLSAHKDTSTSSSKHTGGTYDAELYWTGRRISVEDTSKGKTRKEESHSWRIIHGRGARRISVGECHERYHDESVPRKRKTSLQESGEHNAQAAIRSRVVDDIRKGKHQTSHGGHKKKVHEAVGPGTDEASSAVREKHPKPPLGGPEKKNEKEAASRHDDRQQERRRKTSRAKTQVEDPSVAASDRRSIEVKEKQFKAATHTPNVDVFGNPRRASTGEQKAAAEQRTATSGQGQKGKHFQEDRYRKTSLDELENRQCEDLTGGSHCPSAHDAGRRVLLEKMMVSQLHGHPVDVRADLQGARIKPFPTEPGDRQALQDLSANSSSPKPRQVIAGLEFIESYCLAPTSLHTKPPPVVQDDTRTTRAVQTTTRKKSEHRPPAQSQRLEYTGQPLVAADRSSSRLSAVLCCDPHDTERESTKISHEVRRPSYDPVCSETPIPSKLALRRVSSYKRKVSDSSVPSKSIEDSSKASPQMHKSPSLRRSGAGVAETLCCVHAGSPKDGDTLERPHDSSRVIKPRSLGDRKSQRKSTDSTESVQSFRYTVGPLPTVGATGFLPGYRSDSNTCLSDSLHWTEVLQHPLGEMVDWQISATASDSSDSCFGAEEAVNDVQSHSDELMPTCLGAPEKSHSFSRANEELTDPTGEQSSQNGFWETVRVPCDPSMAVETAQGFQRDGRVAEERTHTFQGKTEGVFYQTASPFEGEDCPKLPNVFPMTVCDQAVNLPLPQLDNAEEQHSGPPSTPSDPNFHPNQAAKHTRSTCQQDDPETFDSSASCAATSHAVETSCAADQDEFTHVSHGGALPQRGRDQIGSEVNVVKPLRVMDNLGLDGESGLNKDISEFKSESEDQSSKLVDNLTVNSKSAPTCEEDFITSVNTLSGYSFDVGKTPERQMKSSSGEGSGSSAHYEEPVSVDNDDNLGAEYLLALTEEPSAREPSDTRKNAGKGQHSRRARGGRRDVEKEMCLRDVEVQTVSGGTLSPSHLSLPVEAACQTAFRAEPAATVDAVHYDDIKSSAFCESDDVTIIKPPPMFCDSDRESKSPSPPAPVSNVDGDAYSSHTADVGKTKRPECLNLNVPGGKNLLAVEDKLENKRDVSQGAKSKKGNPDTSPNFAGVTNFPTTTRTDTFDFEESSDFPKNPSVPTEPPNRCNLEQHGNVEQDDSKDPALVREEDNHQDLATTASEATPKNVQLNSSGDDQSHPCMGLDEQVEPSIRQQHDCGKGHRKPPASHKEEGSSEQGHSTSVNLCNEGIAESAKDRKDHISSGPSEKGGKTSEGRKGASSKDKRSSEKGRPSKTQEHLKKSHTRRETEGVLETVSSGKQTVEKTIKTTTDNATKIEKGDKGTKAKTKKASDLNEAEKPSEDRPETSTVRKPEEKREEKSTDAAENTVTTESGAENTQRGTEKTEKGVTGVSAGTEKATENTAANVSRTTEEAQKNAAEARDRENFRFSVDEVPEMQVMVNSLTPVLQRRKAAARRSNSHSGVAGGSSSNDNTPCSEDLQKLLAAFVAHAEEEQAKEEKEKSEAVRTQTTGDSEVVIRQTPGDQKRERSAEKKTLSCKMPGESTAADPCQDGGSGLFIKPKFARTWHGPVQAGGGRAAPRMGLAVMTSDTAALALGHAVRGGGRGGQSGIVHVHTLPVISRTLLDAMHKRYCSYQYSASNAGGMTPLPPPKPPETSLTFSLPPSLASAPLKKLPLNSEGESDTGSSAATSSTQSSPRTPHTGQDGGEACGGDGGDDADGQHSELPSPDSSPATSEKRNGHVREQEIEAVEACEWLRAAGFPQYAQMFEDGLFPVDISDVQRDHDFLDGDSIQSVIRRLNILNTCAVMKIDAQPCKKAIEESDEEDLCALSDRWEYQKTVRRWSRKGPDLTIPADSTLQSSNSHDSLLGEESGSHTDESPVLDTKMPHAPSPRVQTPPDSRTLVVFHQTPEPQGEALIAPPPGSQPANSPLSPKLRRAASERLKSALKRMESFTKKSKKYPVNRSIVEISGPVVADQESMQAKLQHLNCVEIGSRGTTPSPVPQRPSPPVAESTPTSKDSRAGSVTSDSSSLSPVSPISPASPIMEVPGRDSSHDSSHTDTSSLTEYYSAHSQLLANFQACGSSGGTPVPGTWGGRKNSDSSLKEIFLLPQDHKPGSFPRLLKNGYIDTTTAPFQASPASPQPPPSTTPLSRTPQGLRGSVGHKSTAKSAAGRISVYDNLSPAGTPQHSSSASGPRKPNDIPVTASKIPVVRSLSVSSTGSGTKAESESSDTVVGMIRSRSASATTSLELQASCACSDSASLGSEGVSSSGTGERSRKPSVVLDEFDAILQNLYRDIDNLSRAIGQGEEQKEEPLYATVKRPHRKDGPREVSFSISEQNRDVRNYSGNSTSGSLKPETQLSQSSSSEKDSLRLEPLSPMEMEDSMDQGPLSPGDDSIEGEEGEEGDMGSQTASSQDSSDELEGSADDTLERIALGARERRDSGVGSSLTRASSERKRKKIRWESFQKSHRPSRASRELQIGGLSVCQLLPLRQLSLLKLTSIMEKCSPTNRSQWSWSVPRFMKRNKAPQFSDKNVFGVPFTVTMQRTGQPLPQCVLYAMRYLRKTSHDAIGIFRKSGVRSRIQKLRDLVESNPDSINFDELQPYDVADLLKQYFRELPECLLTNKLSDTFRSIFAHVPKEQRLEALQTAVILLPEENREVLHCLLLFLGDIAQHSDEHQMNASNLAVCFAPSLFNFLGSHGINSPRRQRKGQGQPEHRELMEQKAVHECFTFMITECKKLFMVPPSMYSRLHLNTLSNMEPVHLDEFYAKNKQPGPDYKTFGEENIQVLLKDAHDKNRGWAPATSYAPAIEVMQRKPQDGHPLRQWKCSVEIEAPPIEVLNRILHERHKWDDDMVSWDVVERLDKHSDVFHYVLNSMAPHPPRHFMVLRYWRPELAKGACALVTKSVEHSGVHAASSEYDQGVRAVELGSSYLIEPCGSGKSRLTFIARTDLRGRCPEWYNRVYGYMCANFIDRLRDSFRQEADGPETKV